MKLAAIRFSPTRVALLYSLPHSFLATPQYHEAHDSLHFGSYCHCYSQRQPHA